MSDLRVKCPSCYTEHSEDRNRNVIKLNKYWVELKLDHVFDGYFSGAKGFNSVKDFAQSAIIKRPFTNQ